METGNPPHIRFEYHAIEDRAASMKEGYYVSKDVLYMYITRPGQKDTHVVVFADYLPNLKRAVQEGRAPASWVQHITALHEAWVQGHAPVENGTPILGWPALAPSTQKMLINASVRTVESLANLDDQACNSIGMGCIGFREKARAWLKAATDTGKIAEELANFARMQREQDDLIEQMRKELALLRGQAEKPAAAPANKA